MLKEHQYVATWPHAHGRKSCSLPNNRGIGAQSPKFSFKLDDPSFQKVFTSRPQSNLALEGCGFADGAKNFLSYQQSYNCEPRYLTAV